jgi:hypothetical protein
MFIKLLSDKLLINSILVPEADRALHYDYNSCALSYVSDHVHVRAVMRELAAD